MSKLEELVGKLTRYEPDVDKHGCPVMASDDIGDYLLRDDVLALLATPAPAEGLITTVASSETMASGYAADMWKNHPEQMIRVAESAPAAPEVDLPYYPMWEEVYKLHQQERILMGEAMERIVAKVRREALEEAAMLAERSEGMDMKGLAHCIRALAEKEQS